MMGVWASLAQFASLGKGGRLLQAGRAAAARHDAARRDAGGPAVASQRCAFAGRVPDGRLVHRVDTGCSGVLLLARDVESARRLGTALAAHAPVGKHDLALVQVPPLSGRQHPIRRDFKHLTHPQIGDITPMATDR